MHSVNLQSVSISISLLRISLRTSFSPSIPPVFLPSITSPVQAHLHPNLHPILLYAQGHRCPLLDPLCRKHFVVIRHRFYRSSSFSTSATSNDFRNKDG